MTADVESVPESSVEGEERRSSGVGTSPLATLQRPLTLATGGTLFVRGLRRRGIRGLAMAAGGGWLLYRGIRDRPLFGSRSPSSGIGTGSVASTQEPAVVERSVTVDLDAEDLHEYWRQPGYLSEVMGQFAQVTPADEDRLHWRIEAPMGKDISWETRFVEDTPGEVLRWETVEGAPVDSEWMVRFRDAPGEQGTEVTLRADFDPPGGRLGAAALGRLDFALESAVATSLNRFKSLAETGEVPTLEGNPSARGQGDLA